MRYQRRSALKLTLEELEPGPHGESMWGVIEGNEIIYATSCFTDCWRWLIDHQ
jgi:hypothetical protein